MPAPLDVLFALALLALLDAGDTDELRVNVPLPALAVVDVALAFVVGVDDDVLARAFDDGKVDDGDCDELEDDVSIDDEFGPRVFSFQVSLLLSDLLDENSAER